MRAEFQEGRGGGVETDDEGNLEKVIMFGEVFSEPWRGMVLTAQGYTSTLG